MRLDQAFALLGVEETLDAVIRPLLQTIGERWAGGALTVAEEHLVSEAVRSRLGHLLGDSGGGVRGVAVLACAPGERHELGLMMAAIALRRDGWKVVYLGADTPFGDAVALAARLGADARREPRRASRRDTLEQARADGAPRRRRARPRRRPAPRATLAKRLGCHATPGPLSGRRRRRPAHSRRSLGMTRRFIGIRWWLGAAFALVAAVSTALVVSQFSTRSQNAFRDRAQELALDSAVVAASQVASPNGTASSSRRLPGIAQHGRPRAARVRRARRASSVGKAPERRVREVSPCEHAALRRGLRGDRYRGSTRERRLFVAGVPLRRRGARRARRARASGPTSPPRSGSSATRRSAPA